MNCTPSKVNSSASNNSFSGIANDLPDLCNFSANCGSGYHWTWYLFMTFLAGVTCSANLISLVVLSRLRTTLTPALRLALMNLSVTDVVGSLSYIYHSIMSKLNISDMEVECKARYLFYVSMNVVTMDTLIYVSVERLLAVVAPFFHSRVDGRKFTAVALVVIWISAITVIASGMHRLSSEIGICIYHVLVPRVTHLINAVLGLVGIGFIVCSNISLYIRARREIILIGRTLVGAIDNRRKQIADMAVKAASTTLAVVIPFATLNTPLYVLMLVFYSSPEFMYSCRSVELLTAFSTLLVVNSLCNPVIYAWKLQPVQAELRKMIPCCARRPGPLPKATAVTFVDPVAASTNAA
ncbi:delta-type opioid receptor-like [Plakobranchus ocellatus]|uniref:Delta-type opioid receptor-like n=1 Tax=Plakobranchus ocellatus TaxID=259542 RepID=A0AAV4ATW2_9GAST|nr:delta-type opioid receptor-like [Plakobranchus ocellatus]